MTYRNYAETLISNTYVLMVNLTKLLLDFYKLVILLAYSSSLIIENMEEVKNIETNKECYDLLTQVYD